MLLASLRTDGSPAHIDGLAEPVMVADNQSEPGPSIFAALFGSGPRRAAAAVPAAAGPAGFCPAAARARRGASAAAGLQFVVIGEDVTYRRRQAAGKAHLAVHREIGQLDPDPF